CEYRSGSYVGRSALTVAALAAGWAAFVLVGNSWATLIVAIVLAALFPQVVFLGHDAGHQQISSSRQVNRLIGLVAGNMLTGVSLGWWVPKHNAHHAHPNQLDRDPDLGTGLIAFSITDGEDVENVLIRLRERFRVPLFPILLLLQGVGLHITSVQSVLERRGRIAVLERVLLLANAAAYLTAVFWVLSPAKAFAFIGLQQALFGLYLGMAFAPNHKGMPVYERVAKPSFATQQVLTARNLIGGRFTTLAFGGLNYQIEHHLFPTMPRPNLVRAQPFVRAFCKEQNLPYREARPFASYRQALHQVSSDGYR
ncbi:MAG: fatty acid desaturase family protein, partial [Acidimicrobiales bacterium]